MFMKKSTLQKWLNELLGNGIKDIPDLLKEAKDLIGPAEDVGKLKREIAELGLKKEIELRDIEHLVKIKEQKLALEFSQKELDLKNGFKDKEMEMQTEYHDKTIAQLGEAKKDMTEMYKEIMKRLPNVNAHIKIGEKP